ncbi:MAG: twin-arginine translocase subunit TatC [Actinomycetota bacterium]|nr:twin-arginine translocase subunit TatC [Actinomycetota bacterium]
MAAATTTTAEGGRMTLAAHLRELRQRALRGALAVVVTTVVSWFFYEQLLDLLVEPYRNAVDNLSSRELDEKLIQNTIAGPFILQLKIAGLSGLVLSSPVWLYQVWAFIMPGLHRNERRWTLIFSAVAGPLFLAGVALGYFVLPKGISMLLSFTAEGVGNYIEVSAYLSFTLRMLIAFGIAFEIPLFVILLNLAGVVTARQLANARRWLILLAFVFAAVATPSADPFSMLALAIPMAVLFMVSEGIAHLVDRRRARRFAGVTDDQASVLELEDTPDDDRPSSLMDPD